MKRLAGLFSICAVMFCITWPESSAAAQAVVVKPVPPASVPVVVPSDWPIRRAPRLVVVRPPKVVVRVPAARFIPVVTFHPALVPFSSAPVKNLLTWEDSEILSRHEGWTEFTLDCNARGRKLWLEVSEGKARIDWAEVVFENGEVQVVDFKGGAVGSGLFSLLDFRDGRHVDHVRMVARASTNRVRITLRMEK